MRFKIGSWAKRDSRERPATLPPLARIAKPATHPAAYPQAFTEAAREALEAFSARHLSQRFAELTNEQKRTTIAGLQVALSMIRAVHQAD